MKIHWGRALTTFSGMAILLASPLFARPQASPLSRARTEGAAGHYAQASALYRQVLRSEPDNSAALAGLVDSLVAEGLWRNAIPVLEHLLEIEPRNAARAFQLGQMRSWQSGQRHAALEFLERAAELDPHSERYRDTYAEVLSWRAAGRPRALAILREELARHPDDFQARRLLGQILSWQQRHSEALATLRPLTLRPDATAEDFWALGQAQEAAGDSAAAADSYRQALSRDPHHLKSIAGLAEILSWSDATRGEAVKLFERGLRLAPNNETLLLPYANMLSWNRATRPRALEYYDTLLVQHPNDPRALTGKAQLLAWSGHSSEALNLYEQVLYAHPDTVEALRGEAEILDWRGRHAQAINLLEQAHGLAPENSSVMLGLARAEYDAGNYGAARSDFAQVKGIGTPDYRELARDISHALGTYVEFGYALRRDGMHLNYDAADAIVSAPLGASNRLSVVYQPSLYKTTQRNFNSNTYALMLDSHPREGVTTHAEIAGRTYPGVPSQIEGAFDAVFAVRPSFRLETGIVRESDQESLVSTLGADTNGVFVGQVESNLGSIGGSYSSAKHNYDVSLTYTDGIYTGQHLDSNRRWGIDGTIGKSLHGDHPYLRAAYGFSYVRFDHDADFLPGSGAPTRVTGGYYSPTRFLVNYAQLFLSTKLGRRASWDAGGFAGAQNAETSTSSFSGVQFASTFSTHFTWSITDHDDLRLGYDYLNVFNAFHRHLFFASWRHYF